MPPNLIRQGLSQISLKFLWHLLPPPDRFPKQKHDSVEPREKAARLIQKLLFASHFLNFSLDSAIPEPNPQLPFHLLPGPSLWLLSSPRFLSDQVACQNPAHR